MPPKPTASTVSATQPASQVNANIIKAFDPSKYTNKNMNAEQVSKLKEVFDLFDYDHSGQVSIEEIHDVIKTLGLEN
jgi:Ca2+-binding EF-hand superfamily protein